MIANLPSFTLPKIDRAQVLELARKAGEAGRKALIWARRAAVSTWPAWKFLWRVSGWISAAAFSALWLWCLRDESGFPETVSQSLDDVRDLMDMAVRAAAHAGHAAVIALSRLPVVASVPSIALIGSYGVVWAVRAIRSKPAPQPELSPVGMLWRGMASIIGGILLIAFHVYWLRQTDGVLMREFAIDQPVTDTRDGLILLSGFGLILAGLGVSYLANWKNARRDRLPG